MTFETAEDVLEHFGVKGQRWGVRNRSAPTTNIQRLARIKEIDRKISKMNAESIYRGAGLTGHYNKKGRSSTPRRRANSRLAALGLVNAAAIFGGGNLALNRVPMSPEVRVGTRVSLGLLAGRAAKVRVDQIRDVNTHNRHARLLKERQELEKGSGG